MHERDIVERIRVLCEVRSWTYYRLAKESGLTYSTLCTMMHKVNAPSIPTLMKICSGFGISLAEFFDWDNPKALLPDDAAEYMHLWSQLTEENKVCIEKYTQFLLSQQEEA